jgi:hypothetical protein
MGMQFPQAVIIERHPNNMKYRLPHGSTRQKLADLFR